MTYDFTRPTVGYEYTCIQVTDPKPGVKVITLNRPDCLNAISLKLAEDLETILQELKFDDKCRVVILTGAGKGFCAGTDLKEMSDFTKHPDKHRNQWLLQKHMANIVELMRVIPQPIIGAINGAAAGGGQSFALACDIRVAVPKAKFIGSYINVGMTGADMGSSYNLTRLVGISRAAELMYTGRAIMADEAERIGLVAKVVEPEELMNTAMEYADILLGKSELGLIMTKESINAAMEGVPLTTQLNFENRNQFICNAMGSFSDGADAFKNKK